MTFDETPVVVGVCTTFDIAAWGFWSQPAAIVAGTYISRLEAVGAVAIGLPPTPASTRAVDHLLDRVDAVLLIGGVDVHPSAYRAAVTERLEATSPQRDAFETAVVRSAFGRRMPILGICRGLHVMNVAGGGTLTHHLVDLGFDEHRAAPGSLESDSLHAVYADPGSLAAGLLGTDVGDVTSHHHQGIDRVAAGAVVTARSEDGLAEALEWPALPYALGVQWHPEAPILEQSFAQLVEAAKVRRKEIE